MGLQFSMLALLLTYALHVTLWTGAAWLAAHGGRLSESTRHVLWRMALIGPLLSTLCSALLPALSVHGPRVHAGVTYALPAPAHADSTLFHVWTGVSVAALLGLLHFARSLWALWRSVGERRELRDPRSLTRLARLRARTGLGRVRLTESPRIHTPMVLGRSEICLPVGALAQLCDAELDSVFAHELAHLERGDGLWFPIAGLVQSLLWLHPLNHFVAARLRHSAELACDDRAVELTGDAMGLARALTEVAAGALFTPGRAAVPSIARSRSALVQRVARLARGERDLGRRHQRLAIAALAVLGTLTVSADVEVARAVIRTPRTPIDVPQLADMDALLQRELQLEAELARAAPSDDVHVLELQQALRHVQDEAAWTEDRLVQRLTTQTKK